MNLPRKYSLLIILAAVGLAALACVGFCADQETVARELDRVLSSREFDGLRPKTTPWARFWSAIGRAVTRLILKFFEALAHWVRRVPGFGSIGHGTSLVLSVVIVAVVIVLGVVIYLRLSQSKVTRVVRRKSWFRKDEEALSGSQLMDKADETSAAGDNLNAFRLAYLAILVRLDEIGAIKFRHDKTNWEYLSQIKLSALSEYRPRLRDATLRFDNAFYGGRGAGFEDFEQAKGLYSDIERKSVAERTAEVGASADGA